MPETIITYFGKPAKVNCDGNCQKAWGISGRPNVQLSDDEDDIAWLADGELGIAPDDPLTYEGGYGKPSSAEYFPNKWCVRECERCNKSNPGEHQLPLAVMDFSQRRYNLPSRTNEQATKAS